MDDLSLYEETEGMGQSKRGMPRRSGVDFVDFIFYDTQTVATTATTQLTFFTTPYGGAKTKLLTNMAAAGYITNALEYHLKSISVGSVNSVSAATGPADLLLVTFLGYMELIIQDKVWFQAPIAKVGYGGGVFVAGGLAAAGQFMPQVGSPNRTSGYKLRHTIIIPKNVNFYVTLNWPTAPTPTAAVLLQVTLEGSLARAGNK